MIQGTSSDAGKSYVVTAICRILANRGYKVAPFKSQNMSNNSYVTIEGLEIGRAQGVQSEAARQEASVYMNPILLKPRMDTMSEVVLLGKGYKSYSGMDYGKEFTLTKGMEAVKESLAYLEEHYDLIVIEGAGSPAEVNLNDREIVNMRIAEAADVDVILVADIDRGGSFASLVGTLELVFEHRHRIKGVVFNKFRGDIRLLEDGLKWFESYTKVKVLGVIPYMQDIYIETEDAQSKHLLYQYETEKALDIAVIHMERVSNNTDVEPFIHEKDCSVRIVKDASEFGKPHAVIIPGTKSTIGDMQVLIDKGLDKKIIEFAKQGGIVFGLCGGFQVLGQSIIDELGVDYHIKDRKEGIDSTKEVKLIDGLGLLPIQTGFNEEKRVKRVCGSVVGFTDKKEALSIGDVSGYEIHLGETKYLNEAKPLIRLQDGEADGCIDSSGNIMGTYLHHIFHNDGFRHAWLSQIRLKHGFKLLDKVDTSLIKEESYEALAKRVEASFDMNFLMDLILKET
jgi:adenosylcobyric acid synthase